MYRRPSPILRLYFQARRASRRRAFDGVGSPRVPHPSARQSHSPNCSCPTVAGRSQTSLSNGIVIGFHCAECFVHAQLLDGSRIYLAPDLFHYLLGVHSSARLRHLQDHCRRLMRPTRVRTSAWSGVCRYLLLARWDSLYRHGRRNFYRLENLRRCSNSGSFSARTLAPLTEPASCAA